MYIIYREKIKLLEKILKDVICARSLIFNFFKFSKKNLKNRDKLLIQKLQSDKNLLFNHHHHLFQSYSKIINKVFF